jgi:hypothetical protein
MDATNGFNELERHVMRAAIVADTRLHCLLPLHDMLYTDMDGELWYFDEEGNLSHTLPSRQGARLGLFIFCIIMAPIYKALKSELDPDGMLNAFSDDVYLHGPPATAAAMISAALALYKKIGLRIGWGRAKFKLALPPDVHPEILPLPRGSDGRIMSHLVHGLETCMGI